MGCVVTYIFYAKYGGDIIEILLVFSIANPSMANQNFLSEGEFRSGVKETGEGSILVILPALHFVIKFCTLPAYSFRTVTASLL